MGEGNKAEAKYVWIKRKWGACGIFLACAFFHSIAVLWMGMYGWNLLFPYCFFLGIPFKLGFALELPYRDRANEPAPPTIETTSAPFKEYDEPPVVTRLASESNIT